MSQRNKIYIAIAISIPLLLVLYSLSYIALRNNGSIEWIPRIGTYANEFGETFPAQGADLSVSKSSTFPKLIKFAFGPLMWVEEDVLDLEPPEIHSGY